MKTVYIYLADGFEEIEALAPADLLRRAGAKVFLVSITGNKSVTGARGVCVTADITIDKALAPADMIILPGGCPGYENLAKSPAVELAIKAAFERGAFVGAICGAPAAILGPKGFIKDRVATCYPRMEDKLDCKKVSPAGVCVDGNLITAKSAGYTIDFALTLIECLTDERTKLKVKDGIVYNG